jgi:hypothetical protein
MTQYIQSKVSDEKTGGHLIPREHIPSRRGIVEKTVALVFCDSVNPYLNDEHFQVVWKKLFTVEH